MAAQVEGLADDGSPGTSPARFGPDEEPWAQDSLTSAYSDPPQSGRVSGGVAAEPVDTAAAGAAAAAALAEARTRHRVVMPLDVGRGGRFEFTLRLDLHDVEVIGDGRATAAVRAVVIGDEGSGAGEAGPGAGEADAGPQSVVAEVGPLVLELRPEGRVIIDGDEASPDVLDPNFRYGRTYTGPPGGLALDAGRYHLRLELALSAEAPLRSGPGELARLGQAVATVRLE
ncbi:MAG: hypothetical protein ACOCUW_00575 [Gemmatimonadota bacterium]